MRTIFYIIFLLNTIFSFSQDSKNIEKIKLIYAVGGSSWGENRIFSRSEIFDLVQNNDGDFILEKQLKIKNRVRNNKIEKDTVTVKNKSQLIISRSQIENLVTELNSNRDNFTTDFLKNNFSKPTKKEILKIAKKNNEKDFFTTDYDEKADTESKILEIQNFKKLSEFLEINKAKINTRFVTMDAWDFLRILVYKKEEITMYDFRFIESFGQPISINNIEILDKKKNAVNIIGNKELQVINLNANLLLQQIVPKKSLTNNILDLNNIRNEYIIWFLKEGRF